MSPTVKSDPRHLHPGDCGAPRRLPVGSRHETEPVFVVVGCSLDRAIDAVEQTPCYSRAKPA